VHRHLVPPGAPAAAEYDFVQGIAREQIAAILAAGQSLIYDDLLLERDNRRKLAAVADDHQAELVLVYLNTPLAVINQRRTETPHPGTQADIAEAKAQLDASLLEPPDRTERAIYVSPADVASKIHASAMVSTSRSQDPTPRSPPQFGATQLDKFGDESHHLISAGVGIFFDYDRPPLMRVATA
jgi:predicted kinase